MESAFGSSSDVPMRCDDMLSQFDSVDKDVPAHIRLKLTRASAELRLMCRDIERQFEDSEREKHELRIELDVRAADNDRLFLQNKIKDDEIQRLQQQLQARSVQFINLAASSAVATVSEPARGRRPAARPKQAARRKGATSAVMSQSGAKVCMRFFFQTVVFVAFHTLKFASFTTAGRAGATSSKTKRFQTSCLVFEATFCFWSVTVWRSRRSYCYRVHTKTARSNHNCARTGLCRLQLQTTMVFHYKVWQRCRRTPSMLCLNALTRLSTVVTLYCTYVQDNYLAHLFWFVLLSAVFTTGLSISFDLCYCLRNFGLPVGFDLFYFLRFGFPFTIALPIGFDLCCCPAVSVLYLQPVCAIGCDLYYCPRFRFCIYNLGFAHRFRMRFVLIALRDSWLFLL